MLLVVSKTVKVTLVSLIVGMEPYHQTRLTQPKKECATTHPLMLMASSLASKDAGRHHADVIIIISFQASVAIMVS